MKWRSLEPGGGAAEGDREKKGSEMQKDSKLQQKESALLEVWQDLERMRVRVEEAEAALRSERNAFEEVRECISDDLNRVQIAHEEAETREWKAVDDCQHALKVFKFKKYKKGYEDGKHGVSQRYSLEIESLGVKLMILLKAALRLLPWSLNAPSSDVAPLTSSSLRTAPDAEREAGSSPATVETSLNTPSSEVAPWR